MSGLKISGVPGLSNIVAEIDPNTQALKTVVRPNDITTLGVYSVAGTSGVMAALSQTIPIYSFRWGNASNTALIKKITMSVWNTATTGASQPKYSLILARSFSASDTGGTTLTPSALAQTNTGKLKTAMGVSLVTDMRISTTAGLTPGTRTLDGQAIAFIQAGVPATAWENIVPPTALWQASAGDYPIAFVQNEGFIIQAVTGGTNTWSFAVTTVWEEIATWP